MRMMNFSPMQMEHVLHMLKFELRVAFPTYAITWVRSSVAERLTADQQVPGSNPGVPFVFLCPGADCMAQTCQEFFLSVVGGHTELKAPDLF